MARRLASCGVRLTNVFVPITRRHDTGKVPSSSHSVQDQQRRAPNARPGRALHLTRIPASARHSAGIGRRSAPKVFSPLYIMYMKPSWSLCDSYTVDMSAAVGGSVLFTKMKIAFSGGIEIRFAEVRSDLGHKLPRNERHLASGTGCLGHSVIPLKAEISHRPHL